MVLETYAQSLERKFKDLFDECSNSLDDRWTELETLLKNIDQSKLHMWVHFFANDVFYHECRLMNDFIEALKQENIHKTSNEMFKYDSPYQSRHLDKKLILEVHEKLTSGLGERFDPGRLRTCMASNSFRIFPDHEVVESQLDVLVEFTNFLYKSMKSFKHKLIVAAFFLWGFLEIHPFKGGNGMTSKFLFQHILRDVCTVPIPLSESKLYIRAMKSGGVDDFPKLLIDSVLTIMISNIHTNNLTNLTQLKF